MRWLEDNATHGKAEGPSLSRWLVFDHRTEERYEAEHGPDRAAHLRHTILFGVLLYLLHDLSTIMLSPDVFWLIALVTFTGMVPFSLLVAFLSGRVSMEVRERLVFFAILGATALPISIMYLSNSAHSSHMNAEVILCIVYGNMLMALRFRYAVVYTTVVLLASLLAVYAKPELDYGLRIAIGVQFVSASIFGLYANYLIERRRCTDYFVSLMAVLRAEAAEDSTRQYQELSKTDALTGLPNRRFLDTQLEDWFSDSRSIVIMMIDIDHFKPFNDTLGHPAGDDCLRVIADTFKSAFNNAPDMFCARFGGEEFVLAVRGAGELQVARLANAIVRSIEALGIPHPGRPDGLDVVTASVGGAFKPSAASETPANLLSRADAALYKAKRRGRNCYIIDGEGRVGRESPFVRQR